MTAQIHDQVRYQGRLLDIAGINGRGLFDPNQHGFDPAMLHTACWRGFYCLYKATDQLELETLHIGRSQDQQAPPPLFNTPGRWLPDQHCFRFDFQHAPIPFSGGLLLGGDFIDEMYVHMGFHPAYKFRVVHELIFEDGRLSEARDRSEDMAAFREDIAERPLRPENFEREAELKAWIARTFRLDYKG